jgi:hypothetical protein
MSEHVKIVYSWIGPRGPIWNTELPNILTLAHASYDAHLETHRVWTDQLYHKLFRNCKEKFQLSSTVDITKDDLFIYPFSLTWRINFENYFQPDEGILEFSHTPNSIIDAVKYGKGFFLIDHSLESFVQYNHLSKMHFYFSNAGIPLNKIIYVTGCMNADEAYHYFLQAYNLSTNPKDKLNLVSYPTHQTNMYRVIHRTKLDPVYDTETVPSKLFLTWNRRFRSHRINLMLGLEKLNLVDRSFVSIGIVDPEQAHLTFAQVAGDGNPALGTDRSHVERFFSRLPLELDHETSLPDMCSDMSGKTRNFYSNSLLSIVTETNYEAREVTTTEKTFKPMIHRHPFIMVGAAKTLASLKILGYQTFDRWWSEDYDNINDPNERMQEILRVCEEIGTWSPEKILQFKREVKPVLDHNFSVMSKDIAETVAINIDKVVRPTDGL